MAYISKDNNSLLILLLLALLLCQAHSQLDLASLSATNYTLQGTSNYTFNFFRYSTNAVPLGSSLILTFDQSYSGMISSPSCSSASFSNTLLNCTFLGNMLTINNLFSNSNTSNIKSFAISIAGITNPSPAKNYVPVNYFQIVTSGGIKVQDGSSAQSITVTPLAAQCSISLLSGIVFSNGSLTIAYTSSFISGASNSSYYLNVAVPTFYPDDSTQTLLNPSFNNIISLQPSNSYYVYTIKYATSITVTLLMPPSTKPQTDIITVTSYDINKSGTVDSCSISLNNVQPNTFSKTTISQQKVQSYSSVQFYLKLSTPLTNFDKLQLNFSNAFDISKINASSLAMAGYSNFGLNTLSDSYGKILLLTASLLQPVLNSQLIFTVPNLGLPFTTAPQSIEIQLLTSDSYLRIKQTNSYSASPGALNLNLSCLSLQIGVSTSCLFTINTSNYLTSNFTIQVTLPSDFQVRNGSSDCPVNGKGLNSISTCLFSATTNTITVVNLNSTTNSFAPFSFTLNINLTLSQKVDTYQIAVTTLSAGQSVDTGSISLTTQQRILKSSQFSIFSSEVKTYSPTIYTMSLSLPFDLGYIYSLILYMPVDAQTGLSPTITNTNSQSYQNFTFNATVSNLLNATFLINNLTTPISTQPATFTMYLYYNGIVQFKGSQSIVNTALKKIDTLSIIQSNQIVYKQFIATFTISGLSISDNVRISANFTPFYDINQSVCSTTVVNCSSGGILIVKQANSGLTIFNLSLFNLAFVGNFTVQVSVYDSLNLYGKQVDSFNLQTTTTNSLTVLGSQTNPYLNESSTYTFNLTFTTPNATSLSCLASSFISVSAQCILNCGNPVFLGGSYIFTLSSTWAVVQFKVTNPINFYSSTKFTFLTGSPQKDYGQYQPQLVCSGTCRSCQTVNSSNCTSCYSWSTNFLLWNKTCVASCPAATYQSTGQCLNCSNVCKSCFGSSTNCSQCISGYFLFNSTCVSVCPSKTFLDNSTSSCLMCSPPCSTCSVSNTNCTSCLSIVDGVAYFYLLNQCYSQQCPITYYSAVTNNTCLSCPISCYSCNSSACLSCPSGNYLYKGVCYSSCPNGSYIFNSSSCAQCVAPCSLCSSQTICSTCITSYLFFNTSCISECPEGYYSNATICLKCNPTCQLCNSTGCITCSNSSYYLYLQSCLPACPTTIHPNNHSMVCETCLSPCKDCTWSDSCLSCVSTFSLMNTSCLSNCPLGYYSDGSICHLCPANCLSCSWINNIPACTTCVNGTYVNSWQCVQKCPNDTTVSGSYCVSTDCSTIDGCLSCSGYRCLQCNSLYKLSNNYTCTYNVNSSAVLSALSQVPVPFPFLIAMLVIIILAFLLKHNFQKMFAPLFIYSVGGVLQQLCLVLWTVLSLLWNANVTFPLPLISVVYGTVLIMIGYFLMNIIQWILWLCRIASDKKYKQWEIQDNRCASKTVWLFSLILSFRLDTIRFSRTAHSERLSARLESTDKFKHYTVLAILGILINVCSILVAAYVFYLQSTMNYLFFSCIEVAIMSVLMIIFSIAMLCVPASQLIETKNDYKFGQDEVQLDGPSLQQVLGGMAIGEEQHDYNRDICSQSGSAVLAKSEFNSQYQNLQHSEVGHSSQKLTDQVDIEFREEDGEQATQIRNPKRTKKTNQDQIFQPQSRSESNHIILDEFQANNQQIIKNNGVYKTNKQKYQELYQKPIRKTKDEANLPSEVESSSLQGDFQQFEINYQNNGWLFTNRQSGNLEYSKHVLAQDASEQNDEFNVIKTVEETKIQEERVAEVDQLEEDYQLYDGLMRETLIHFEQSQVQQIHSIQQFYMNQNIEEVKTGVIKDKQVNRYQGVNQKATKIKTTHKIPQKQSKESRQDNFNSQIITLPLQSNRQQEKIKQTEVMKAQIDHLRLLEHNYKLMEQKHLQEAQRLAQIEAEQNKLKEKIEEQERQFNERVNMEIEDRLSKTASIVYALNEKLSTIKTGHKKIAKNQNQNRRIVPQNNRKKEQSSICNVGQFKYINEDEVNLSKEYKLKQIKIKPTPHSSTYKRKHIFVEKQQEIYQFDSDDGQGKIIQQREQKKVIISKRTQQMQKVDKKQQRKVYSESQKILKEHSQQDEQQEENVWKNQNIKLNNQKLEPSQEEWKHLEQALGRITFDTYEQVLQVENQSECSNDKEEEHKQQKQSPRTARNRRQKVQIQNEKELLQKQQSQITVFNHQIIRVQPSQKSLKSFSDQSHWPVEPQLIQKIQRINQKADQYIKQPLSNKNQQILQAASLQIYQEESQDSHTVPQILYQQQAETLKQEEVRSTKTKIRKGRVNRRVIDLSPQNK